MKINTVNQPLLFVDSVFTECQVDQQTMYKTPQIKPQDIHQSDFVHAFDTKNIAHSEKTLTSNQYVLMEPEVQPELINVNETMNHREVFEQSTKVVSD